MSREIPCVEFKGFSLPRVHDDGSKLTLMIEDENGPAVELAIPTKEVGAIIAFLVEGAAHAGKLREAAGIAPSQEPNSLCPVEAYGMGFAAADEDLAKLFPDTFAPDQSERRIAVVIRLGTVDLAFRMGNMRAADIPAWLRHSAHQVETILGRKAGGKGD